MSTAVQERDGLTVQTESVGWVHLSRPEPALAGEAPGTLLARSAQLPGNFRYGSADGTAVALLGEVPQVEGVESFELPRWPWSSAEGPAAAAEDVEAALDDSGFAWKRREAGWAVPAAGRLTRDVCVSGVPSGVRVEAVLVQWDEIGAAEAEAVARLLCRAHLGLRFARCELDAGQARVVALVASDHVAGGLAWAVGGVAAGAQMLAREVGALLVPEVARVFLEFCRYGGKAPAAAAY